MRIEPTQFPNIGTATVATDDKVLIQDTSDSNNLKSVTAQSIADLSNSGASLTVGTLTALSASQNNYDLAGATFARISATTPVNITGLTAGSSGQIVILNNIGAQNITLIHQSVSSTAANRFLFENEGDNTMGSADLVFLVYDDVSERWKGLRF